jgi:TetR/AcrR family transcriptional repressor of nem operon
MTARPPLPTPAVDTRTRILDAALAVIRAKGYSATTVDELCATAGVTKGAFFHHFSSKEDLGVGAADYWTSRTGGFFAAAPYQTIKDPLQRLLGYVDFRAAILAGRLPEFTCLVGTMVQEVYETHPQIRDACDRSIRGHAATLEPTIAAAMKQYRIRAKWTAASLALHTQAVLQGAFILAKSSGGAAAAAESVAHLRRYIELLFAQTPQRRTPRGRKH